VKHFDCYDMGFPIERLDLITQEGGVYVYECNTCKGLTLNPKGHEQWHEGQA
jgi:hypothetical protein